MSTSPRATKLLALVDLINKNSKTILDEWEREDSLSSDDMQTNQDPLLPTWDLYNAQRTLISVCGAFTELVQNPQLRLLEMSVGFFESRALHVAVEHRIPDILATADRAKGGMYIGDLSAKVGIDVRKLARIMRTLTSAHVFEEVGEDHFANNRISTSVVGNEPLRACLMIFGMDSYIASQKLPDVLRDSIHPTSPPRVAFKEAMQIDKPYFDWLTEKIERPDGTVGPRPSLEIFSLAMLGGGRVMTTPMNHDFPWESFGHGTVVDVGGGIGSMSLELAQMYPNLKFVVQDTAATVEQAERIWKAENTEILYGRVALMAHDFFKENPIKKAEAYVLRYIMHDWDDDHCIRILKAIRASMGSQSRLLVAEQVMNTTVGCKDIADAPAPLPANYGVHTRLAHCVDCATESLGNGMERTPPQLRALATRAGLQVMKFWECRGVLSIMEMRLPSEQ